MFEKVNPKHPDKIADRIAGAIVDLAYKKQEDPRIAVEVLIGHGKCHIIAESSVKITRKEARAIVERIAGKLKVDFKLVPQDEHLSDNQKGAIRCGDNGIFKGMPVTQEQRDLVRLAKGLYDVYKSDGKYIYCKGEKLVICQSNATEDQLVELADCTSDVVLKVNPLGYWTGGTDVDAGATNRKLGSDMGDSVTGGGLHGKDLSKADVSVNIYAFLRAQATGEPVELSCAIGDEEIDELPYSEIVEIARDYIKGVGGFEKFAEWGLIS